VPEGAPYSGERAPHFDAGFTPPSIAGGQGREHRTRFRLVRACGDRPPQQPAGALTLVTLRCEDAGEEQRLGVAGANEAREGRVGE